MRLLKFQLMSIEEDPRGLSQLFVVTEACGSALMERRYSSFALCLA
jgi:hypothetical protein